MGQVSREGEMEALLFVVVRGFFFLRFCGEGVSAAAAAAALLWSEGFLYAVGTRWTDIKLRAAF